MNLDDADCAAARFVIAELVADGLIVEIEVPNGSRYRLSEVHAVPEVQPPSPQVNGAVLEVQRVPVAKSEKAVRGQCPGCFIEMRSRNSIANGVRLDADD